MFAATILLAAALVAPASSSFTVVNSASFQAGPVARGALLTIYTTPKVSPDKRSVYDWVPQTPNGLIVEASCNGRDDLQRMPITFVGEAFGGNHINFYYPNELSPEQERFGTCENTGESRIRITPAGGGIPLEEELDTLMGHPGIFMAGEAPSGDHATASGGTTVLADCRTRLQTNPKACPVRTSAGPGELWLHLTGAEWFRCEPTCDRDDIFFELATRKDAPGLEWVPQTIQRIFTAGTGHERAVVRLKQDTAPGVYWIRVRNTFRKEFPDPLRVDLGQPA